MIIFTRFSARGHLPVKGTAKAADYRAKHPWPDRPTAGWHPEGERFSMDPKALTSTDWHNIHLFLQWFWIYFPLISTFAITMLTAHALIPSAVSTGHLPAVRPSSRSR